MAVVINQSVRELVVMINVQIGFQQRQSAPQVVSANVLVWLILSWWWARCNSTMQQPTAENKGHRDISGNGWVVLPWFLAWWWIWCLKTYQIKIRAWCMMTCIFDLQVPLVDVFSLMISVLTWCTLAKPSMKAVGVCMFIGGADMRKFSIKGSSYGQASLSRDKDSITVYEHGQDFQSCFRVTAVSHWDRWKRTASEHIAFQVARPTQGILWRFASVANTSFVLCLFALVTLRSAKQRDYRGCFGLPRFMSYHQANKDWNDSPAWGRETRTNYGTPKNHEKVILFSPQNLGL